MSVWQKQKLHKLPFLLGLLAVAVMALPYMILGQDAIVTCHDQLDGELPAYFLQAKHLFSGGGLPEFLNGADKTALTLPAPGFVLLFLGGNPFAALAAMQVIGSLCGYVGMYLLIPGKKAFPEAFLAAAVAVLYAYLPFLPVYGLSQYGIPLLLWSFLQLKKGSCKGLAYAYIGLYTLCSSLVLSGFAVLLLLGVWILWRERKCLSMWLGWGLMAVLYVCENIPLLGQLLTGEGGSLSHKAEYVLTPAPFFGELVKGLLEGGQHSRAFHKWLLLAGLVTAGAALWQTAALRKGQKGYLLKELPATGQGRLLWQMGVCLGINLSAAFLAALWSGAPGIFLRTRLSALGAFQVQRVLWLSPCFWYLLAGCTLLLAAGMVREAFGKAGNLAEDKEKSRRKPGKISSAAAALVCLAAFAVTGFSVLLSSNLKPNLQKLRNPAYEMLSFRDYYAVGVLEQASAFLKEYTGKEPSEYRVASLGIDPAAALYHGFYCLDGYSNNYALEYKHSFREIIAPELSKSQYLREYYDNWGNRCYLVSAETPGYYTIEKNGFYFQDYSLNTKAFKELGGRFILSAAYIANGEEAGLKLLHENPFETEDSYYRIYIYEVL